MSSVFDHVVVRYQTASDGFAAVLAQVREDERERPTPCSEWNVAALVNHMVGGNANYVRLAGGAGAEEFLANRDTWFLREEAKTTMAYRDSVRRVVSAFSVPGRLRQPLDYPLGRASAGQCLAIRTVDSLIHSWDLARAIAVEANLDADLVIWALDNLHDIFDGMSETPIDPESTGRFFAPPVDDRGRTAQSALLARVGRSPNWVPSAQ